MTQDFDPETDYWRTAQTVWQTLKDEYIDANTGIVTHQKMRGWFWKGILKEVYRKLWPDTDPTFLTTAIGHHLRGVGAVVLITRGGGGDATWFVAQVWNSQMAATLAPVLPARRTRQHKAIVGSTNDSPSAPDTSTPVLPEAPASRAMAPEPFPPYTNDESDTFTTSLRFNNKTVSLTLPENLTDDEKRRLYSWLTGVIG